MVVLGYLPNLKRCLGLPFGAHFQYYFSIKMFLNTLSVDKSQCYIFFPSRDIKQNVLLSSYLHNCWRHKIYFPSSSKPKTDREKKRGRRKYKNLNNIGNEKSFLDEIKSIFRNYLRLPFGKKKKRKLADTSFNGGVHHSFVSLFCMSKIERL